LKKINSKHIKYHVTQNTAKNDKRFSGNVIYEKEILSVALKIFVINAMYINDV
jgi:hypothetical protein